MLAKVAFYGKGFVKKLYFYFVKLLVCTKNVSSSYYVPVYRCVLLSARSFQLTVQQDPDVHCCIIGIIILFKTHLYANSRIH